MERLDICVQHRDVVDALALNMNTKSLDLDIKSELGAQYTPSIAFQIKMELQRLNKLSTRPIRSHVINEKIKSISFVFNGIEHHLDKKTLLKFQTLCAQYNNRYTVGVEESILEFIKSNQETIIQSQLNDGLECTPINMSEMIYRSEERMFLGIRAEMFLKPDKQDPTKKADPKEFSTPAIDCVTQNISNGGLKAKSKVAGTSGDLYFVRYTGLEKEFSIAQPYILYKLIKCINRPDSHGESSYIWLMAKCESEHHNEFNNFLSNLIKSNSGRYKFDIDNIQRSVINNITEQFLTNRQNEIGMYFNKEGHAKYAYGSVVSNSTYSTYLNSNKSNVFSSLVEKDNLLEITKEGYVFWGHNKNCQRRVLLGTIEHRPIEPLIFQCGSNTSWI